MRGSIAGPLAAELMSQGVKKCDAHEMERLDEFMRKQAVAGGPVKFVFPGESMPDMQGGVCLPMAMRQRELRDRLLAKGNALSIERRRYIVYFYDNGLAPQHFIL